MYSVREEIDRGKWVVQWSLRQCHQGQRQRRWLRNAERTVSAGLRTRGAAAPPTTRRLTNPDVVLSYMCVLCNWPFLQPFCAILCVGCYGQVQPQRSGSPVRHSLCHAFHQPRARAQCGLRFWELPSWHLNTGLCPVAGCAPSSEVDTGLS